MKAGAAVEHETSASLYVAGTPYLRTVDGRLRRALRLRLPVPYSGPAAVRIAAAGEEMEAPVELAAGEGLVCGGGIWDRPVTAHVTAHCPQGTWSVEAPLAPTRPWTIHIAQDKHLDYGWIHPVEQVVERMNTLLDYHLNATEGVGLRWNLDVSKWVEEYLDGRPSWRRKKLLSALRSGTFEVGALWLVPFPGLLGTEEWLQSLYYARYLEETFGIPVRTASLQEVPSAPWGLPTILAGAGITHLVKGAYDLRNPHLRERDPQPLSAWQGPDGSCVLLKWDAYAGTNSWGGYAEAYTLWRKTSEEERVRFVEETAARYDGYPAYPLDAILLAGTGFDEYPQTTAVSDFVRRFNARGWEYPRLVDSTWDGFWQEVERQISGRQAQVPVVRGDWGTTWEEWPAQLAHLNAVYRRARETVLAAQSLSALAFRCDPATHPLRRQALAAAWQGLLQFADHNIGGITETMADDMRDRKATYAYSAAREGSRALESGIATLAAAVPRPAGDERLLLVANANSWPRTGLVEVMVPEPGPYEVVAPTGRAVACQVETRGAWPEQYLSFVAEEVPPFGYRCYTVRRGKGEAVLGPAEPSDLTLENAHFALAVDPETGGLRSLVERAGGRELANPGLGLALNQYLHRSGETLHRPQLRGVTGQRGTSATRLTAEVACGGATLHSTYTLHEQLNRLDIANALVQASSAEPQSSWFAFPQNVASPHYYYDGAAAILSPGLQPEGDLLPGSGGTCLAVQTFLAAAGSEGGTLLAMPDTHLVQLGEQALSGPLADSDPHSPLVLSLVKHNWTRNDHAVDQGGQTRFCFRYSLRGYSGAFRPAEAVRFGKEVGQPLAAAWVIGEAGAPLARGEHAFLSLAPGNLVATGLKVAEDGRGWILRLWECEGRETEAEVNIGRLAAGRAWSADLLERTQQALPVRDGVIRLSVPAWGLRAIRFA